MFPAEIILFKGYFTVMGAVVLGFIVAKLMTR